MADRKLYKSSLTGATRLASRHPGAQFVEVRERAASSTPAKAKDADASKDDAAK